MSVRKGYSPAPARRDASARKPATASIARLLTSWMEVRSLASNIEALSESCKLSLAVDRTMSDRSIGDEAEEGSIVTFSSAEEAVDGLLGLPLAEL